MAVSVYYLSSGAGSPETARAFFMVYHCIEFGVRAYLIVLIGIVRDDFAGFCQAWWWVLVSR